MYINVFLPVRSSIFEVHKNVRKVIFLYNIETKSQKNHWSLNIFLLKMF